MCDVEKPSAEPPAAPQEGSVPAGHGDRKKRHRRFDGRPRIKSDSAVPSKFNNRNNHQQLSEVKKGSEDHEECKENVREGTGKEQGADTKSTQGSEGILNKEGPRRKRFFRRRRAKSDSKAFLEKGDSITNTGEEVAATDDTAAKQTEESQISDENKKAEQKSRRSRRNSPRKQLSTDVKVNENLNGGGKSERRGRMEQERRKYWEVKLMNKPKKSPAKENNGESTGTSPPHKNDQVKSPSVNSTETAHDHDNVGRTKDTREEDVRNAELPPAEPVTGTEQSTTGKNLRRWQRRDDYRQGRQRDSGNSRYKPYYVDGEGKRQWFRRRSNSSDWHGRGEGNWNRQDGWYKPPSNDNVGFAPVSSYFQSAEHWRPTGFLPHFFHPNDQEPHWRTTFYRKERRRNKNRRTVSETNYTSEYKSESETSKKQQPSASASEEAQTSSGAPEKNLIPVVERHDTAPVATVDSTHAAGSGYTKNSTEDSNSPKKVESVEKPEKKDEQKVDIAAVVNSVIDDLQEGMDYRVNRVFRVMVDLVHPDARFFLDALGISLSEFYSLCSQLSKVEFNGLNDLDVSKCDRSLLERLLESIVWLCRSILVALLAQQALLADEHIDFERLDLDIVDMENVDPHKELSMFLALIDDLRSLPAVVQSDETLWLRQCQLIKEIYEALLANDKAALKQLGVVDTAESIFEKIELGMKISDKDITTLLRESMDAGFGEYTWLAENHHELIRTMEHFECIMESIPNMQDCVDIRPLQRTMTIIPNFLAGLNEEDLAVCVSKYVGKYQLLKAPRSWVQIIRNCKNVEDLTMELITQFFFSSTKCCTEEFLGALLEDLPAEKKITAIKCIDRFPSCLRDQLLADPDNDASLFAATKRMAEEMRLPCFKKDAVPVIASLCEHSSVSPSGLLSKVFLPLMSTPSKGKAALAISSLIHLDKFRKELSEGSVLSPSELLTFALECYEAPSRSTPIQKYTFIESILTTVRDVLTENEAITIDLDEIFAKVQNITWYQKLIICRLFFKENDNISLKFPWNNEGASKSIDTLRDLPLILISWPGDNSVIFKKFLTENFDAEDAQLLSRVMLLALDHDEERVKESVHTFATVIADLLQDDRNWDEMLREAEKTSGSPEAREEQETVGPSALHFSEKSSPQKQEEVQKSPVTSKSEENTVKDCSVGAGEPSFVAAVEVVKVDGASGLPTNDETGESDSDAVGAGDLPTTASHVGSTTEACEDAQSSEKHDETGPTEETSPTKEFPYGAEENKPSHRNSSETKQTDSEPIYTQESESDEIFAAGKCLADILDEAIAAQEPETHLPIYVHEEEKQEDRLKTDETESKEEPGGKEQTAASEEVNTSRSQPYFEQSSKQAIEQYEDDWDAMPFIQPEPSRDEVLQDFRTFTWALDTLEKWEDCPTSVKSRVLQMASKCRCDLIKTRALGFEKNLDN